MRIRLRLMRRVNVRGRWTNVALSIVSRVCAVAVVVANAVGNTAVAVVEGRISL